MSERPWIVKRSRPLLKDRWIDLRADDCVTGSGQDVAPYYVLSYPDWVHVVAITPEDCLVLVRQYRHAAGKVVVEIPGGALDASDVNDEAAARRELAEETGYVSSEWTKISSLYPNPATHTNRVHVYLALNATRECAQALDAGEEVEVIVLPIDSVLENLGASGLEQAMHVSAVLLALAAARRLQVRGIGFRGSAAPR